MQGGRLAPEEHAAWGAFLRSHATILRELDDELQAEHQLALGDYDVLVNLAQAPGRRMRMCDLADAVVMSRSGLTRRVERLEGAGLVRRAKSGRDGRTVEAALTEAGLERLREANLTHLAGVQDRFLRHFSPEDLRRLGGLLARVAPPGPGAAG
jgi:DNA-binding MarR family transcriptional regulator